MSQNHHKWQAQVSSGFEALLGMASSELDRTKEVRRQSMESARDPAYQWASHNGVSHNTDERRGSSPRGTFSGNNRSPIYGGGSITSGLSAMSSEATRSPCAKHVSNVKDTDRCVAIKGSSNNTSNRTRTSSRSSVSTVQTSSPQQSDEESIDRYSQYNRLFKKKLYKDWKKQNSPKIPTTTSATSTLTTNSTDTPHHEETRYGKFRHWERKGTCSPASATNSGNHGSGSTTGTPLSSESTRSTTSQLSECGTPTGRSQNHSASSPPSRPGSAFHYPHMPTLQQQNLHPPTLSPHTPYSASSVGSLPPHGTPTPPILTAHQHDSRPSSRPSSAGSSTHTPVGLPPMGPHSVYQAQRPGVHLLSEGLVPYQPPPSPLSRDSDTSEVFSRPLMHPIKGVMTSPHVIEMANRSMFPDMNGPHRGPTPPGYPPTPAAGHLSYNTLLGEMNMIRASSAATDLLSLNRTGVFPAESLVGLYPLGRVAKDVDWQNSAVYNSDSRVPNRP